MRTLAEPKFHLLMAALLLGSLWLDQAASSALPTWTMPAVGLLTFALGLVWVALFAAHRIMNLQQRLEVLDDLLQRVQRRTDALEDETRRRRGLPFG